MIFYHNLDFLNLNYILIKENVFRNQFSDYISMFYNSFLSMTKDKCIVSIMLTVILILFILIIRKFLRIYRGNERLCIRTEAKRFLSVFILILFLALFKWKNNSNFEFEVKIFFININLILTYTVVILKFLAFPNIIYSFYKSGLKNVLYYFFISIFVSLPLIAFSQCDFYELYLHIPLCFTYDFYEYFDKNNFFLMNTIYVSLLLIIIKGWINASNNIGTTICIINLYIVNIKSFAKRLWLRKSLFWKIYGILLFILLFCLENYLNILEYFFKKIYYLCFVH